MQTKRLILSMIAVLTLMMSAFIPAPAWKGDDILGNWYTDQSKALVNIYKNKSDIYFGRITWQKNPNEPDGSPKLDKENPDQKLRKNPILGLLILKGFKYEGDRWTDGTIYDPDNGKTYKCTITMENRNTLFVRGYVGISAIGRTTTWNRKTN
ncbi:MAG TPA: DUF2147 domain-containing protein [Bacteroidales bacterium]|nr:DUF2147 domain-containing protein [Bacteroidales bacterium]HRZ50248.1 DUF2147 domain-containing protein [Bacteroidales bacterium]